MARKPVALLGSVVAGLLAGCGAPAPAQITIANRTDAVLTVGPGLVIPACGATTTSQADYQTARNKGVEMAINGQTWDAPAGALVWDLPIVNAQGVAPTGPLTVVVSSTADPEAWNGTIDQGPLPACGRQPRASSRACPRRGARVHDGAREPVATPATGLNRARDPAPSRS